MIRLTSRGEFMFKIKEKLYPDLIELMRRVSDSVFKVFKVFAITASHLVLNQR